MLCLAGDHGGVVETVALRLESVALDAGSDELGETRLGRSGRAGYKPAQGVSRFDGGASARLPHGKPESLV